MQRTLQKSFKLFLSAVLILGMLSSLLTVAASEETSSSETLSFLTAMDIVLDTNVSEADFVTKGELARYLCHMMNDAGGNIGSLYQFVDVEASDALKPYISTAVACGYLLAETDEVFGVNRYVSLSEIVDAMLNCLGYTSQVRAKTSGWTMQAIKSDIVDGISVADGDPVRHRELFEIIWNTVRMDMLQIVSAGDKVERKAVKGDTILKLLHHIYFSQGKIVATDKTYLDSDNALNRGYIQIDNYLYYNGVEGLQDFIGRIVKFYYRSNPDSDISTVVWAQEYDPSAVLEINAKDITITGREASYEKGEKIFKEYLSPVVNVIYNGRYKANYTASDLNPSVGTVVLIDSDHDNIHETVVVTSYLPYVISAVDYESQLLFDLCGRTYLDFSGTDDRLELYLEGERINFSQLEKNDVLLIASSEYTVQNGVISADIEHSDCIRVLVSRAFQSGTVEEISENDEEEVTISGQTYVVSEAYQGEVLTVGLEAIFFLDSFGEIVFGYVGEFSSSKSCAYLVAGAMPNNLDANLKLKLFDTKTGKFIILEIANAVTVDGDRKTGDSAVNTYLSTDDNGVVQASVVPQLVLYSTNKDGKISYLDTKNGNEANSLELTYSGSAYYVNRVFGNKAMISTNATVVLVPQTDSGAVDILSEDKFKVTNYNYFLGDNSYDVEAYNMSDYAVSNLFVCNYKPTGKFENKMYMIADKRTCVLPDETLGSKISLMSSSAAIELMIDSETLITDKDGSRISVDKLCKGDVIQIAQTDGMASAVKRQFTLRRSDNSLAAYSSLYVGGTLNAYTNLGWGIVHSKGNGALKITYSETDPDNLNQCYVYNISGKKIIRFDEATGKVTTASMDSLIDYTGSKNLSAAQRVLIHNCYGNNYVVFVYQLK